MSYPSLQEMETDIPFLLILHDMVWTMLASQDTSKKFIAQQSMTLVEEDIVLAK